MCMRNRLAALVTLIAALTTAVAADDVINISVRGISDSKRDGAQQDRLEAIMDAKRQACEKAGVTITSKTSVENFKIAFDYVESQAQAVLLPGFQVMDVGYMEDGTFAVVIVGSVRKVSAVPSGKSLFTLVVWFTDQGTDITGKDALLDKLYAWMTRFGASLNAAGAAMDTYESNLVRVSVADSAASSGKRYYAFTYSLPPGDIAFAQKLQNTDGGSTAHNQGIKLRAGKQYVMMIAGTGAVYFEDPVAFEGSAKHPADNITFPGSFRPLFDAGK